MANYKELGITVHEREFVKNLLYVPLTITSSVSYRVGRTDWLEFKCSYVDRDERGNDIERKDILVSTKGSKLIEAGKQFRKSHYPIDTVITVDKNGFYEFT